MYVYIHRMQPSKSRASTRCANTAVCRGMHDATVAAAFHWRSTGREGMTFPQSVHASGTFPGGPHQRGLVPLTYSLPVPPPLSRLMPPEMLPRFPWPSVYVGAVQGRSFHPVRYPCLTLEMAAKRAVVSSPAQQPIVEPQRFSGISESVSLLQTTLQLPAQPTDIRRASLTSGAESNELMPVPPHARLYYDEETRLVYCGPTSDERVPLPTAARLYDNFVTRQVYFH